MGCVERTRLSTHDLYVDIIHIDSIPIHMCANIRLSSICPYNPLTDPRRINRVRTKRPNWRASLCIAGSASTGWILLSHNRLPLKKRHAGDFCWMLYLALPVLEGDTRKRGAVMFFSAKPPLHLPSLMKVRETISQITAQQQANTIVKAFPTICESLPIYSLSTHLGWGNIEGH